MGGMGYGHLNTRGSRTAASFISQVPKLVARGAIDIHVYNLIACGKWVSFNEILQITPS